MIMASRLLYGMAKQNIVPSLLGRVGGRKTPVVAIVYTTLVAFALVATGELDTLADTTVLLLLIVFTLVNICALLLRNDQVDHDYFRAPVVFPVLGALSSLLLLTQQEAAIWLRAGILMVVGLVLWGVNRAVSGPLESIEAEKLQD
jgi:amino acid transporter